MYLFGECKYIMFAYLNASFEGASHINLLNVTFFVQKEVNQSSWSGVYFTTAILEHLFHELSHNWCQTLIKIHMTENPNQISLSS